MMYEDDDDDQLHIKQENETEQHEVTKANDESFISSRQIESQSEEMESTSDTSMKSDSDINVKVEQEDDNLVLDSTLGRVAYSINPNFSRVNSKTKDSVENNQSRIQNENESIEMFDIKARNEYFGQDCVELPSDKYYDKIQNDGLTSSSPVPHSTERPFICFICDKRFNKSSDLYRHTMTHSGERPYACSICSQAFVQKSNLVTHMRTHTGERPHKCTECEKTFTRSEHLKRHVRTHTGEKPYSCDKCDKTFNQSSALLRHAITHTDERPFVCIHCDKRFTQRSTLVGHIRIHTGEKPYTCILCEKSFTSKSDLTKHTRIHTGIKPYKCKYCTKSFTRTKNLNIHMNAHAEHTTVICVEKNMKEKAIVLNHSGIVDAGTDNITSDKNKNSSGTSEDHTDRRTNINTPNTGSDLVDQEEVYKSDVKYDESSPEIRSKIDTENDALSVPGELNNQPVWPDWEHIKIPTTEILATEIPAAEIPATDTKTVSP